MVSNWQPLRPDVKYTLIAVYGGLALYGLNAELFGAISIFVSYGPVWGSIWPLLIFASAAFALIGMFRTIRTKGKFALEYSSGALLVGLLLSYGVAIIIRGFEGGAPLDRTPYFWMPLIISVIPFFRLVAILPRRKR